MKLECRSLRKIYHASSEGQETLVLKEINLAIESGECVALLGASGSGKSTLLHCLALLDDIDGGQLFYEDRDVTNLDEEERARFRLENLGFVFQFHHLIPELSALENVELPASLLGKKARAQAAECLDWVGLGEKRHRFPWQLSGGEQQRVAVARALVNRPRVLFTDEATGNLDRDRAHEILEILLRAQKDFGTTLLSVTHDAELAARYGKRYRLKDGLIWALVPGEPS